MSTITTKDGTELYYKDWGSGQHVVFSHGWPLSSDGWKSLMFFLASYGYRCIAHDRRGHGHSSQPWEGMRWTLLAVAAAAASDEAPSISIKRLPFANDGNIYLSRWRNPRTL